MSQQLRAVSAQIEYTASDGKPMAETDTHRDLMVEATARQQAEARAATAEAELARLRTELATRRGEG